MVYSFSPSIVVATIILENYANLLKNLNLPYSFNSVHILQIFDIIVQLHTM